MAANSKSTVVDRDLDENQGFRCYAIELFLREVPLRVTRLRCRGSQKSDRRTTLIIDIRSGTPRYHNTPVRHTGDVHSRLRSRERHRRYGYRGEDIRPRCRSNEIGCRTGRISVGYFHYGCARETSDSRPVHQLHSLGRPIVGHFHPDDGHSGYRARRDTGNQNRNLAPANTQCVPAGHRCAENVIQGSRAGGCRSRTIRLRRCSLRHLPNFRRRRIRLHHWQRRVPGARCQRDRRRSCRRHGHWRGPPTWPRSLPLGCS